MKPKHQRLTLVLVALAALIGATLLAMWGLKDKASYFATPSDIAAGKLAPGKAARLGGMVVVGSLEKQADGVTIAFRVSDLEAEVPVRFTGITPSLFREGSGVVAEGKLSEEGVFLADKILAKHDEKYMPPEVAEAVGMPAGQAP